VVDMEVVDKLKKRWSNLKNDVQTWAQNGLGTNELKGLIESLILSMEELDKQNQNLKDSIEKLNTLSNDISEKTNELHRASKAAYIVGLISLFVSILALMITVIG
jgi:methyl-accepting chemotaxis protein